MTTLVAQPSFENPLSMLSRSQKAFLLTVALYTVLIGAAWLTFKNHSSHSQNTPNQKQVAISAKMFEVSPPKPVVPQKMPPKVQPKPVPKKPVIKKKAIPKHIEKKVVKKVVKPKVTPPPVVKPTVVKKEVVKKPITKPVVKPTPIKKAPVAKTPPQPTAAQRAAQASAEKRYTAELQNALYRYAQNTYPFMAKRRHWEGKVTMTFTLHKDGKITDVHVTEPDMRDIFNQAAMSIFTEEMQMHFKPFPKDFLKDIWVLTVPISYNLR